MKKPSVSVLIATYNRANLLCKAIESVLSQDYPSDQYEIIVVDDGSTDNTRNLVETKYGDKVRYLFKENGGINSAFQFGVDAANGQFIAQLDSDDYWYPNKLSKCIPLLEKNADVVAVLHDLDVVKAGQTQPKTTCWKPLNLRLTEEPCDALQIYLDGYPLPARTSGSVWRKSVLEKILPFPEGLWGFNDAYCIRNSIFFGKVCALKEPLGVYLIHSDNDYAGVDINASRQRIERAIRESRIMAEAFNRRCREFGVTPSLRRTMIQNMALAEYYLSLEQGKIAAIRWLWRDKLSIPYLAKLQLLFNIVLPQRCAIFIKNRVIGKLIPLD